MSSVSCLARSLGDGRLPRFVDRDVFETTGRSSGASSGGMKDKRSSNISLRAEWSSPRASYRITRTPMDSAHSSVARSVLAVAQKWVPDSTLAAANASKCPPTATSSALRPKKRTVLARKQVWIKPAYPGDARKLSSSLLVKTQLE